jgi:hypothetical protein
MNANSMKKTRKGVKNMTNVMKQTHLGGNPSMHWNTNRGMMWLFAQCRLDWQGQLAQIVEWTIIKFASVPDCTANGSFLDGDCSENGSFCACFMPINVCFIVMEVCFVPLSMVAHFLCICFMVYSRIVLFSCLSVYKFNHTVPFSHQKMV